MRLAQCTKRPIRGRPGSVPRTAHSTVSAGPSGSPNGASDDVAGPAQPAAMLLGLAGRGQPGANPPRHHRGDDRLDPGTPRRPGTPAGPVAGCRRAESRRAFSMAQSASAGLAGPVRTTSGRPSASVTKRPALTALLPAIRGLGPCVTFRPALIAAPSITAPPVLRLLDWERLVIGPEGRIDRRLYTFCAGTAPGRTPTTRPVRAHQPAAGVIPTPCSCKGRPGRRCGSGVCRTLGRSPGADEELESLGQAARRSLPADPPATFRPIPP